MTDSQQALEAIAQQTLYGAGVSGAMVRHSFTVFSRFLRPGPILELGVANLCFDICS